MINDVSRVSGYANPMTLPSMEMRRNDFFNKVDSNTDGGIDKVEISDLAKKLSEDTGMTLNVDDIFSTYDADNDGKLSQTELDGFMRENAPSPPSGQGRGPGSMNDTSRESRLDDLFAKVDEDSDGSISKDELSALVKKLTEDTGNTLNVDDVFSTYDADGDGKLNKTELDGFMRENAPPPPGGQKLSEETGAALNVEDIFSAYDTDGDGKLSKEELNKFMMENLPRPPDYPRKAEGGAGERITGV